MLPRETEFYRSGRIVNYMCLCSASGVPVYRRFPDTTFPGCTFPGQDVSPERRFPENLNEGILMYILLCVCSDHPRRAFGGLYHCAKFGWSRCGSFDNMQRMPCKMSGVRMHKRRASATILGWDRLLKK